MRLTLEDIETFNRQHSNILQKYFPNLFPEVLVPITPMRRLFFIAGSALSSDMSEINEKIKMPFENLRVAKEYVETAKSDIQSGKLAQPIKQSILVNSKKKSEVLFVVEAGAPAFFFWS